MSQVNDNGKCTLSRGMIQTRTSTSVRPPSTGNRSSSTFQVIKYFKSLNERAGSACQRA